MTDKPIPLVERLEARIGLPEGPICREARATIARLQAENEAMREALAEADTTLRHAEFYSNGALYELRKSINAALSHTRGNENE